LNSTLTKVLSDILQGAGHQQPQLCAEHQYGGMVGMVVPTFALV
jgi:hypothetical protein